MNTVRLTMAQALVRWLMAQRTEIDGVEVPLFPGRVRDLRPRQRHLPQRGAGGGQGRAADLARAERAVDGAGGDRLRQGQGAPPDHGGGELDRAGGHQHGHRRRRRAHQPPAGPAALGRLLCLAPARSRCCSRSSTGATRRSASTTPSSRSPATGTGSPGPSSCSSPCPRRLGVLLDPADCGPAFLGLCQDVQAEAFDYPERFFAPSRPPHSAPARPTCASSSRRQPCCARPGSRC